jgi:hypothetical protein
LQSGYEPSFRGSGAPPVPPPACGRDRAIGGAIIGGAIAGPPGAVVGGAVGAGAGAGAGEKAEDVAKDDVNRESDWNRERTTDEVVPPR